MIRAIQLRGQSIFADGNSHRTHLLDLVVQLSDLLPQRGVVLPRRDRPPPRLPKARVRNGRDGGGETLRGAAGRGRTNLLRLRGRAVVAVIVVVVLVVLGLGPRPLLQVLEFVEELLRTPARNPR